MSSTNRGTTRRAFDAYATPSWCVDRLLEKFVPPGDRWLEPAAGHGAIVRAVQRHIPNLNWTLVEIRDDEATQAELFRLRLELARNDRSMMSESHDFLTWPHPPERLDVCITNPPYSKAAEFVRKGMSIADHVVMLLRLNFLGSARRHPFFRDNMPDVYVLPNRPSFTDGSRTDSTEYCWMHFDANHQTSQGKIVMLDTTPIAERRRGR